MMGSWEPRPLPEVTAETEPFWAGTLEGEYRLQACDTCGETFTYPRSHCPACHGGDVTWKTAAGTARVYSFSWQDERAGWPAEALPVIVARVELAEGPRVVTTIVETEPEELSIGDPLEVVFVPTERDLAVPVFRPVE